MHVEQLQELVRAQPFEPFCVLMANGERLLLSGDIDAAAERALLDSPLALPTDWLQAPHHGSRSSSSNSGVPPIVIRAASKRTRESNCHSRSRNS